MAKWRAEVQLDDKVLTMYTEAEHYSAAYIKIMAKLPSRCARGDCKDGIITLVQDTEQALGSHEGQEVGENDQKSSKKSIKINILDTID